MLWEKSILQMNRNFQEKSPAIYFRSRKTEFLVSSWQRMPLEKKKATCVYKDIKRYIIYNNKTRNNSNSKQQISDCH